MFQDILQNGSTFLAFLISHVCEDDVFINRMEDPHEKIIICSDAHGVWTHQIQPFLRFNTLVFIYEDRNTATFKDLRNIPSG